MKSGLKIRWSQEAIVNLESIIIYLENNWTPKELSKFFKKLEKQILLLALFPEAFPVSKQKSKIHRCVFLKNLTIYYITDNEHLVLLTIFDTRQHPSIIKA